MLGLIWALFRMLTRTRSKSLINKKMNALGWSGTGWEGGVGVGGDSIETTTACKALGTINGFWQSQGHDSVEYTSLAVHRVESWLDFPPELDLATSRL